MSISPFPLLDFQGTEVELTAAWIGPPGEKPDNYTFLARKQFTVNQPPDRAVLHVCADSRYCLYLNGQRVGNGPARGTDGRYFFDSYDVTAGIAQGRNVIAARVHCPVKPLTSAVAPVTPALFVQLEPLVHSDASWQVCIDPSYRADALMYTHHIGYSEYRDLRREPVGWLNCEDTYADWTVAEVVSSGPTLEGRCLSPRDIPALTDNRYRAQKVVKTAAVPFHHPDAENELEYADLMQREMHMTPSEEVFVDVD